MKNILFSLACFLSFPCFQSFADVLSTEEKATITNELQNTIINQYVLTENIDEIKKTLVELQASKEFQTVKTPEGLAKILATAIRAYDGHFTVQFNDPTTHDSSGKDYEHWFSKLERKNSGFNKVEVLKGNVGYIDFWGFNNLNESSKAKAKAALTFVEDTDAVIFDLRKNGGGSAVMIQFISGYFLKEKTHLNSFYSRQTGQLTEFWTFDDIEGKVRPNVPLYILTSDYTFSAAEEFAYNFKNLKRATIIGESTGGGANPINVIDLGNGFRASIPISKAVNPISKTNWEGVGVQPDVVIDSETAFEFAYQMALETLKPKATNPYQLKEINEQLQVFKIKK
jgi:C-terminal processing protease CtpA/Prc